MLSVPAPSLDDHWFREGCLAETIVEGGAVGQRRLAPGRVHEQLTVETHVLGDEQGMVDGRTWQTTLGERYLPHGSS